MSVGYLRACYWRQGTQEEKNQLQINPPLSLSVDGELLTTKLEVNFSMYNKYFDCVFHVEKLIVRYEARQSGDKNLYSIALVQNVYHIDSMNVVSCAKKIHFVTLQHSHSQQWTKNIQ